MRESERYEILRPLGADGATFAAVDAAASGARRLVVIERLTGPSPKAEERAAAVGRARALMALANPRIVRVRDVIEREAEVLAIADFADGEWLSFFAAQQPRLPLDVTLRMVLDALDGLAALHDLRDDQGQPRPVIHGGVAPEAILVGIDGVAQIARAARLQRAGTEERFVAPELRQRGGTPDVRSDIYSVGTILRDLLGAMGPDEKWAEPLTEVAWRACSFERESRWPSAATMAAGLRRSVGARLATPARVAALARERIGEHARIRRTKLESLEGESSAAPLSVRPSDMEVLAEVGQLQADPQTMRPPVGSRPSLGRIELAKAADRWGVAHDDDIGRRPTTHKGLAPPPPPMQAHAPPHVPVTPPPPVPRPASAQAVATLPPPAHAAPPAARIAPVPVPELGAPPPVSPAPPPPTEPRVAAAPVPASAAPSRLFEPAVLVQPDLGEFSMTPAPASQSDAYRRALPTLHAIAPNRGRFALQAAIVALGMVLTFGVGWWTGHTGTSTDSVAVAPASSAVPQLAPTASAGTMVPAVSAAANLQAPSPPPIEPPPTAPSLSVLLPSGLPAAIASAATAPAPPAARPEPSVATSPAEVAPADKQAPRPAALLAPASSPARPPPTPPAAKAPAAAAGSAYNPNEL